ncbi:unnamed protein product, partial [Ostreobium quekettii]
GQERADAGQASVALLPNYSDDDDWGGDSEESDAPTNAQAGSGADALRSEKSLPSLHAGQASRGSMARKVSDMSDAEAMDHIRSLLAELSSEEEDEIPLDPQVTSAEIEESALKLRF